MPSGSEKDVLWIVAQEGGETSLSKVIRSMRCYSGQYTRCVCRSLGTHDYLDMVGGKLTLTKKGAQSLRLSEEDWQEIGRKKAEKEQKEKEESAKRLRAVTPLVGSELTALRKVQESRRATREEISQEMNISTAQTGLLFQWLIKRGYITGNHSDGYEVTAEGQKILQEA